MPEYYIPYFKHKSTQGFFYIGFGKEAYFGFSTTEINFALFIQFHIKKDSFSSSLLSSVSEGNQFLLSFSATELL